MQTIVMSNQINAALCGFFMIVAIVMVIAAQSHLKIYSLVLRNQSLDFRGKSFASPQSYR
jgi:hypothetical protein